MSSDHNRNPQGRNQYNALPPPDDPEVERLLRQYVNEECMTSNALIRERLVADTDGRVVMSKASIGRRRELLGLFGVRSKKNRLSAQAAEQAVLDQMDKDRGGKMGPNTIKKRLAFDSGIHLARDLVRDTMKEHNPEGFYKRAPGGRTIERTTLAPIGIHEKWSADGHDKLYRIGFPIWAITDFATSKILGAWVVPSNRQGHIIAYLFLCAVEEYKGIPLQMTTDCGSETTQVYGLINALREIFFSEVSSSEHPPHRYVASIRNIVMERTWLRLRIQFGDNAVLVFEDGIAKGYYSPGNPDEDQLCQWLWSKLLRRQLSNWVNFRNGNKSRKDNKKLGPSGVSPNHAFSLHQQFGLDNCILPLDEDQLAVIREMKEHMGGDAVLNFVSDEFNAQAQAAYDQLAPSELTFENIWLIFLDLRSSFF